MQNKNNIKYFRKKKKMTQEELAALIFVTPQAVSKWEKKGLFDINTLAEISEHLDNMEITIKNGNIFFREVEEMKNNTIKERILSLYKKDYICEIESYLHFVNPSLSNEKIKTYTYEIINGITMTDTVEITSQEDNFKLSVEGAINESDNHYLLDFRAFDDINDTLIDAYLIVYNKEDLSIVDEEIDDVWSWADWKQI